jgi:hypothetical protein
MVKHVQMLIVKTIYNNSTPKKAQPIAVVNDPR